MKRAFVIGHPIAHSRSPLIHGHWIKEHKIEGSYEAIDVAPDDLEAFFERLRTHRSDIAIGGRPPDDGIVGERFLDNPIVVITAPDDPLAKGRRVRVEELGSRPWLLREEGSGTRSMTAEFLAGHDLHPPIRTLGSNGAIKQAARAGLGVSLQSRLATHLEVELGLLGTIHVDVPLPRRQWYVIRRGRL